MAKTKKSEHRRHLYQVNAGDNKGVFFALDFEAQPVPGDFVGVSLNDSEVIIHKWRQGFSLPVVGVVQEFHSYFDQSEWRAQTQERVEASAKLLPQMPKKARAKRNLFPRWLAA